MTRSSLEAIPNEDRIKGFSSIYSNKKKESDLSDNRFAFLNSKCGCRIFSASMWPRLDPLRKLEDDDLLSLPRSRFSWAEFTILNLRSFPRSNRIHITSSSLRKSYLLLEEDIRGWGFIYFTRFKVSISSI